MPLSTLYIAEMFVVGINHIRNSFLPVPNLYGAVITTENHSNLAVVGGLTCRRHTCSHLEQMRDL
jgi:hypothetical protein